ncbi:MAG: PAS domain S-box protein, partial [Candidatus Obscuribacterales bacterium]|nr:PAS domain S-box protein [Candidatus Obscuribacterales bacterium]
MSLSLRQQGMVAISSLLFLELLFVGCHFLLLQQAEEAASTRQRTRESMDRASQLLQNLYTAGDRVGSYGLYKREQDLKAYLDAKSKCQETMSWLKQNVHGQPEQVERVQSMDENIKLGFSVLDKMKRSAENGNSAEATKFSVEQKLRLQPRIEELVDSLRDFMSTQRVIEEKSPEIRRQNRGATFVLLIAASISNIVLAFAIGFLFSRSITSRLKVLIDNSHLLEQGQPLRAPLEGDDEIARLDNAFHDMSSSLRGEEALLRASQRAVISLIAQMPAGVLMIDDKGSIELSNDSMIDMLSYASEDMPGKSFSDLIVSAFESDRTLIASLLQTDKGHVAELHARRKDGTTFPVEVALANFSDGDKDRYLSIIMDVSAKQEMQNLKKTFVAMVSHELRTPLTHVFGYLDLLKMGIYGPVTSLAETAMEESIEKTQQLTNLINDLLDMEKLDAGMFDIVKE